MTSVARWIAWGVLPITLVACGGGDGVVSTNEGEQIVCAPDDLASSLSVGGRSLQVSFLGANVATPEDALDPGWNTFLRTQPPTGKKVYRSEAPALLGGTLQKRLTAETSTLSGQILSEDTTYFSLDGNEYRVARLTAVGYEADGRYAVTSTYSPYLASPRRYELNVPARTSSADLTTVTERPTYEPVTSSGPADSTTTTLVGYEAVQVGSEVFPTCRFDIEVQSSQFPSVSLYRREWVVGSGELKGTPLIVDSWASTNPMTTRVRVLAYEWQP